MIDYAIKRQDWYYDQRNKILAVAIALLGLASFLVTGLLSHETMQMRHFRLLAADTLLAIVGTSISIIVEYIKGASETYIHRSLADIRSWYFRYVVNDSVANAAIDSAAMRNQNRETLLGAWERFVNGWMEYEQRSGAFVVEDLQQVFILYLFQAMRQRSLRIMISCASTGAVIIAVCLVVTIIFAWLGI
jgi:hypothetical protein